MPITLTLTIPNETSREAALVPTVGFSGVVAATPADQTTRWAVRVVGMDGTVYGELTTAVPTRVLWQLNLPDECDFEVSLDDPNLAQLPLAGSVVTPHREVQVWRNGHLLFWGPPTTRRVDRSRRVMVYSCKNPLWYLGRRYNGKAQRHNFLTNGTFEAALSPDWVTVTGPGLTATQATDQPLDGTHSLKLVGASSVNADRYEYQRFTITTAPDGLALFASAWVYVGTFLSAALFARGLMIQSGLQVGVAVLNANTPRGQWVRLETFINLAPNVTQTVEVRLYGIGGTIWWDTAAVSVEESMSFVNGADEGAICTVAILTAQGRGPLAVVAGDPIGKSDLQIGTRFPVTGVRKHPVYQFADHQKFYDGGKGFGILDEFLQASDGLDIAIEYTATTRTAVGYFPTRGVDRTGQFTFTYRQTTDAPAASAGWGIVDYSYGESIENTANQVTELGGWSTISQDLGASREEAGYSDPAALGGLTLELVETAAQGVNVGQLQAVANQRGVRLEKSVVTPTIIVEEPRDQTGTVTQALIGLVLPGDIIAIDLYDGALAYQGHARLASVELNPATERLTLVPNL